MAIYQVVEATIHCDDCGKFLARATGDNKPISHLERMKVTCADCLTNPKPFEPVKPESDPDLSQHGGMGSVQRFLKDHGEPTDDE